MSEKNSSDGGVLTSDIAQMACALLSQSFATNPFVKPHAVALRHAWDALSGEVEIRVVFKKSGTGGRGFTIEECQVTAENDRADRLLDTSLKVPMNPVQSSNIAATGHASGVTQIEFKSGGVYRYRDDGGSLYMQLADAVSVGKAFYRLRSQLESVGFGMLGAGGRWSEVKK